MLIKTQKLSKNKPRFRRSSASKYMRFILLFLFTPVLITIPFPLIFFLSGEFSKGNDIKKFINSDDALVYGFATQDDSSFKREIVNQVRPQVLALGSSRVMQFRQEAFKVGFYNGGGLMNSIEQGYDEFQNLLTVYQPKLVIIGIDFWWFNDKFQKPVNLSKIDKDIKIQGNYKIKSSSDSKEIINKIQRNLSALTEKVYQPYFYIKDGKLSIFDVIYIYSLIDKNKYLGLNALINKDGFARDGFRYYTSFAIGKKVNDDKYFRDTLDRISKGYRRFEYGSSVNSRHFENFISILKLLEKNKIKYILFFPPFAKEVNDAIAQKKNHYNYMKDLKNKLRLRGVKYYDLQNSLIYHSNSCEFIDGFHGGEITYQRILLEIAKQDKNLSNILKIDEIKKNIKKYTGLAQPSIQELTRSKELDFLSIGCKK
jgi:hypothetical protein